jgi:hypothetical protein
MAMSVKKIETPVAINDVKNANNADSGKTWIRVCHQSAIARELSGGKLTFCAAQ